MIANNTELNRLNTNQFSFYTPAAYFTKIDFEFRISFENDINICNIHKSTTTATPNNQQQLTLSRVVYRRILFRFFRLCTA